MSSLPESLMHFRTDLEEAIGREQAARLRQGRRRSASSRSLPIRCSGFWSRRRSVSVIAC